MPFHVPEDKRIQNAEDYSDVGWMNSGSFNLGWVKRFATEDEEFEVVHIEKPDMPRRRLTPSERSSGITRIILSYSYFINA